MSINTAVYYFKRAWDFYGKLFNSDLGKYVRTESPGSSTDTESFEIDGNGGAASYTVSPLPDGSSQKDLVTFFSISVPPGNIVDISDAGGLKYTADGSVDQLQTGGGTPAGPALILRGEVTITNTGGNISDIAFVTITAKRVAAAPPPSP